MITLHANNPENGYDCYEVKAETNGLTILVETYANSRYDALGSALKLLHYPTIKDYTIKRL